MRDLNTRIIQTRDGFVDSDVRFAYDDVGLNTTIKRYLNNSLKVTTTNAYDRS